MSLEAARKAQQAENEGVWEKFPEPLGGEGLIAHHDNPDYRRKRSRYLERLRKKYKSRGITSIEAMILEEGDRWDEALRDMMAGATLRAIRGVEESPGVPLENTPENIRKVLDTRVGFETVEMVSHSLRAEVEEEVEDAAGNSEPSSVTEFAGAG